MNKIKSLFFVLIISAVSGLANAVSMETVDVKQFKSLWIQSFSENSLGRLMTLYSENAVISSPSRKIINGKEEIINYLEGLSKSGIYDYNLLSVDSEEKEGVVYETGLWEATRIDERGNISKLGGSVTNILEKQDNGSWKIKFQNWN